MKENFDVKAITYAMATPDEVALALIDEKLRVKWDPNIRSISK